MTRALMSLFAISLIGASSAATAKENDVSKSIQKGVQKDVQKDVQKRTVSSEVLTGEEVKDAGSRGKILGSLFGKLASVPYNTTNLATGVGAFIGENLEHKFFLSCSEKNPGRGGDIQLRCDFEIGYGQSPSMKISFSGVMSGSGDVVKVDAGTIKHEISF